MRIRSFSLVILFTTVNARVTTNPVHQSIILVLLLIIFKYIEIDQNTKLMVRAGIRSGLSKGSVPSLNISNSAQQIYVACRVLLHYVFNVVGFEGLFELAPRYEVLDLTFRI